MAVYSSLLGSAVGGYLGYTTGDYGGAGIHLMSGYGEVVATTSGAKLCYGQNTLSVTGSGAHTNCTMQALAACGLTGQDFAAFVRSPREGGGADYGLRYEEFIALCIRQIQRLQARVERLEG